VAWLEAGSGPPLVLVHGAGGSAELWPRQLDGLADVARVVAPDLPGHGALGRRGRPTIAAYAEWLDGFLTAVVEEPAVLVGHSMGGAIAQEMALRSPGRLMSLTLHDTGYHFDRSRNESLVKWNAKRNRIADEQGMPALAAIPSPFPQPPFMPREREAEARERLARMSPDGFIGAGAGLDTWPGTKDRLANIAVPTLVIYGELEVEALLRASKHMGAAIPGAVLVEIPQCGHSPQYERPELFNAALRQHLERTSGGTAK
jgi:pimeloyl-ACP methyl ester carboxylesterase